jgi:sugar O-acyltransferase (sialic acid O-acetyltransferase NeuD family)
MSGVLIVGAGGHAKVIADILLLCGRRVLGFLDDQPELWGQTRLGLPVLGAVNNFLEYKPDGLIIGVGDNSARRRIADSLNPAAQKLWCNAIHPRAVVAESVQLGHGIVIAAGAVVNADSRLGNHLIINTSASVDHDCTVADFAHVAPGVRLGGKVTVGQGAFLGIGSSLIPGLHIGAWTRLGAGSVLIQDLPDGVTAYGIPAKPRE